MMFSHCINEALAVNVLEIHSLHSQAVMMFNRNNTQYVLSSGCGSVVVSVSVEAHLQLQMGSRLSACGWCWWLCLRQMCLSVQPLWLQRVRSRKAKLLWQTEDSQTLKAFHLMNLQRNWRRQTERERDSEACVCVREKLVRESV